MRVLHTCFLLATCDRHGGNRLQFVTPQDFVKRSLPWGVSSRVRLLASASEASVSPTSQFAKHALLISSFSDGISKSPDAQSFLKAGLARALAADNVRRREEQVVESVLHSPCAGPDVGLLDALEDADETAASSACAISNVERMGEAADETLRQIRSSSSDSGGADERSSPTYCRVLYIPTAMFALNPNSSNTPGKQRQRARADGKKRRNLVVDRVEELLGDGYRVLAATLDLDDGSVKQPTGSDDAELFPRDGRDALKSWAPHLVYVEGGNTFWLRHCIEKGGWTDDLLSAITGPDGAVYCGKSAGAIVAGSTVETATWKGWDDPSVVPGRETYEDWKGCKGLAVVGEASFFPHMSDEWENLVAEKKDQMDGSGASVYCLREWEACCVNGDEREVFVVSGEH